MSQVFHCAKCGEDFESERSDEDALAEALELWGQQPNTHAMAIVCEDCFQKMTAILPPHEWRARQ